MSSSTGLTRDLRFDHYWEYAKLWRTWVVGIAVAAMFILLNKEIGGQIQQRAQIALTFIAAADLQVIVAFLNKTSAYYEYREACREADTETGRLARWLRWPGRCWVRFWCWLGDRYFIDFAFDLISLGLVGWGVWLMVVSLL